MPQTGQDQCYYAAVYNWTVRRLSIHQNKMIPHLWSHEIITSVSCSRVSVHRSGCCIGAHQHEFLTSPSESCRLWSSSVLHAYTATLFLAHRRADGRSSLTIRSDISWRASATDLTYMHDECVGSLCTASRCSSCWLFILLNKNNRLLLGLNLLSLVWCDADKCVCCFCWCSLEPKVQINIDQKHQSSHPIKVCTQCQCVEF